MQISMRTPYARGVDQLMYVGDDGTPAPTQTFAGFDSADAVAIAISVAFAPPKKALKYGLVSAATLFFLKLAAGKLAV